jgi:hypothetical protein
MSMNREGLMVEIMNCFTQRFGNGAILKGGMELRLFDCPRLTNDLDYVFVPYSSKKEIKDAILSELKAIAGVQVSMSVHSACIRYIVCRDSVGVQVEVNVAADCKSDVLSTGTMALAQNIQPRLIRVMCPDMALAHKLAAWVERRLLRDLYDAAFMKSVLGVVPDMSTLLQRLSAVSLRQKRDARKISMSLQEFIDLLDDATGSLQQKEVDEELRDYFLPEQLPGLSMKIRVGVSQLLDFLKQRAGG